MAEHFKQLAPQRRAATRYDHLVRPRLRLRLRARVRAGSEVGSGVGLGLGLGPGVGLGLGSGVGLGSGPNAPVGLCDLLGVVTEGEAVERDEEERGARGQRRDKVERDGGPVHARAARRARDEQAW